jgi:hypothetical protein
MWTRVLLRIKRAGRVEGLYVMLALCMGASEYVLVVLGASGVGESVGVIWDGCTELATGPKLI